MHDDGNTENLSNINITNGLQVPQFAWVRKKATYWSSAPTWIWKPTHHDLVKLNAKIVLTFACDSSQCSLIHIMIYYIWYICAPPPYIISDTRKQKIPSHGIACGILHIFLIIHCMQFLFSFLLFVFLATMKF